MGPLRALGLGIGSRATLLRVEWGARKCLSSGWMMQLLVQYIHSDADIRAVHAQLRRTSSWVKEFFGFCGGRFGGGG